MHELGLVMEITKTVEGIAIKQGLEDIIKVNLIIGEVSGVIPEYIEDAFQYFKKKTKYMKNTELFIKEKKALTFCENCRNTYSTVEYKKICPFCKSDDTYLIEGNEFIIDSIEAK